MELHMYIYLMKGEMVFPNKKTKKKLQAYFHNIIFQTRITKIIVLIRTT